MRILVVGSAHEAAMEHSYIRHLSRMGIANELFPAQNIFFDYYYASIFNKVKFRLGFSHILQSINEKLLDKAARFKPNAILVFKGMEVLPATLRCFREQGTLLVNYNPDSPFIFSGRGSGNRNVSESIDLFDLYISYDQNIYSELKRRGVRSAVIPFGFELSNENFQACLREEEIIKICFLGNPDHARVNFINQLAKSGLPIDVYGMNWHQFRLQPNVDVHGPVYGLEFWKTLRRYRVQLNLMRPHNLRSHNMRSIEVPGAGGIGLFPETPDHLAFFNNGREIFLYNSVYDCVEQARNILELSADNANKIREQARNRSVQSGYSYFDRTKALVQLMEEIV